MRCSASQEVPPGYPFSLLPATHRALIVVTVIILSGIVVIITIRTSGPGKIVKGAPAA